MAGDDNDQETHADQVLRVLAWIQIAGTCLFGGAYAIRVDDTGERLRVLPVVWGSIVLCTLLLTVAQIARQGRSA